MIIEQLNRDLENNNAPFTIVKQVTNKGIPQYIVEIQRTKINNDNIQTICKELKTLNHVVDDYNNRLLGLKKFKGETRIGGKTVSNMWFKSKKQCYYFNPGLISIEESK